MGYTDMMILQNFPMLYYVYKEGLGQSLWTRMDNRGWLDDVENGVEDAVTQAAQEAEDLLNEVAKAVRRVDDRDDYDIYDVLWWIIDPGDCMPWCE